MSHQSGIQASEDLRSFFAKSKDGSVRLIKICIAEETLVLGHHDAPQGNWEQDYDRCIKPHLDPVQSCYLLYRLDSTNELGEEWIFISWVPNHAQVRQKMLYASTRATLRKEFGDGHFCHDLQGYIPEDVTLAGYKKHMTSQDAPPPLTFAEMEIEEIKKNEIHQTAYGEGHQTMKGIDFPFTDALLKAIKEFESHLINYFQMTVDTGSEIVNLGKTQSDMTADRIGSHFPANNPCYHIFRFTHTFENEQQEPLVFIYSMPGYKCSIKERMLYSSCKASVVSRLESMLKTTIGKKMEVEKADEVSTTILMDEFHPAIVDDQPKFTKPKGPGGRGPRRIVTKD